MSEKIRLSIVIPVYNEEKNIGSAIENLYKYCQEKNIEPEVLICDNGSTDSTSRLVEDLNYPRVKYVQLPKKSFGLAYKKGIEESSEDLFYFSGIDFPFGLDNISNSIEALKDFDLVYSSKGHPDSLVRVPLKRKLVSGSLRFILNLLFRLGISDTQGCLLARKKSISKILIHCDSTDFFFQTQLAIYSRLYSFRIREIPVVYTKYRDGSKVKIFKDGGSMLRQMIQEYSKYRIIRNEKKSNGKN